jgi:hypothetical protein
VRFARPFFTTPGPQGLCPLDAELSWPARCDSDLRREGAVYGTTDESYRESQPVLERILGRSLSVQALETGVTEAGEDVTPFSAQSAAPTAAVPAGTILVVQADGQGVPMVLPPTQRRLVRLGQGQKRGQKQEAVVTGLYPVGPYPRTAQEVVAALLPDPERPAPAASHGLRAKNGAPPWRGRRSPGVVWRSGSPSARGPTSSRAWPSLMAPRPCNSSW